MIARLETTTDQQLLKHRGHTLVYCPKCKEYQRESLFKYAEGNTVCTDCRGQAVSENNRRAWTWKRAAMDAELDEFGRIIGSDADENIVDLEMLARFCNGMFRKCGGVKGWIDSWHARLEEMADNPRFLARALTHWEKVLKMTLAVAVMQRQESLESKKITTPANAKEAMDRMEAIVKQAADRVMESAVEDAIHA